MTITSPECRDLFDCVEEFVGVTQFGDVTSAQLTNFERLLRENEEARHLYAELVKMSVNLPRILIGIGVAADRNRNTAIEEGFITETAGDRHSNHSSVNNQSSFPTFPAILPALPASSSLFPSTLGYSGWTISYLSATVITGLLILGFWLMPASDPKQVAKSVPSSVPIVEPKAYVGRITGMVDCKIGDSRVSLGQKLDLASGLMEITYETGAKVILQGPVTYEVESNGGYLAVGKLTGKMEKKANPQYLIPNPFVIHTPTATVTDRGTEFGVDVTKEGATEVYVYQGEVSSQPCMVGDRATAAVRVKEGQAVRIERQGRNTVPITFVSGSFVRKMNRSKEWPVETAYIEAVLADKPLGYWPLNEPRYSKRCADRSGNGFHGVPDMSDNFDLSDNAVHGMPTGLPTQPGPMPGGSNAVAILGGGRIDFGRQDRFAFTGPFTVEGWIWTWGGCDRRDSLFTCVISAERLTCKEPETYEGWELLYQPKGGPLKNGQPCMVFVMCNSRVEFRECAFDTASVPVQQWVHVALVCHPGKAVYLYLNGRGMASMAEPCVPKGRALNLAIGQSAARRIAPWNGRLAHVAVYPYALTESQIQNHYQLVHEAQGKGG